MFALGAEPHACAEAYKIYQAATEAYNAEIGVSDYSKASYGSRRGWHTPNGCSCPRRGYGIAHINSIQHILAETNTTDTGTAGKTLLAWMRRNGEENQIFKTVEALTEAYPNIVVPEYATMRSPINTYMNLANFMLTPAFMEAVFKIFPNNATIAYILRIEKGIKVDWLTTLTNNLTRATLTKLHNHDDTKLVNTLAGARNMNAHKVAAFLNAGIYANIYTYIKNGATPEQALTVYKATEGETTLAAMLREGHSIPGAVNSVSA